MSGAAQRVEVLLNDGSNQVHNFVLAVRLHEGSLIVDTQESRQIIYAAHRWLSVQSMEQKVAGNG